MPKGHVSKKKGQARKVQKSELAKAREAVASYKGLVARICSFHRLEGEDGVARFNSVAKMYAKKEEERRDRPPAF